MLINQKTGILAASCILIVVLLCLVQFYLIRNTYNLTRDKYYEEVRGAIGTLTANAQTDSMYYDCMAVLRRALHLYRHGRLSKKDLHAALIAGNDTVSVARKQWFRQQMAANPLLHGVRYKYQLDHIILYTGEQADTLLRATDEPFVFMGEPFDATQASQIGYGAQIAPVYHTGAADTTTTFRMQHRQFIDITGWQHAVLMRMAGVFLLATALILAVIALFYSVFRAMIRQKQIADIKTDFANNITHEIKTPLSSLGIIIKSLHVPAMREDDAMFASLLQSLERQHAKLQYITDSVLESSMLPQTPVRLSTVSMPGFIHQVVTDFKNSTHVIHVHARSDEQTIRTDPDKLQTILYNLLDNAVKYSPQGSAIGIHAFTNETHCILEVHDSGPGIATHEHERIFSQFYRVPEGNRHTTKGLGLGLYLSRMATAQLGGSLTVKSTAGKGSIFILTFPLYGNV